MKKWKTIIRYYIQDNSKTISSNMRLLLQKDNTYSGGTYFARKFRFLFQAKLFVKHNKTLCYDAKIVKRIVIHTNAPVEDFVKWELEEIKEND